jgi:hypothetical protein
MNETTNKAIKEISDIAGHWTRMAPPAGIHDKDCWMYHATCALVRIADIAIETIYEVEKLSNPKG